MILLETTLYDLGAVGCIFFLASGLLKIVTYLVKKQPCKAIDDKTCPLYTKWLEMDAKLDTLIERTKHDGDA